MNHLSMSSVSINYPILYTAGPENVLQLPLISFFFLYSNSLKYITEIALKDSDFIDKPILMGSEDNCSSGVHRPAVHVAALPYFY